MEPGRELAAVETADVAETVVVAGGLEREYGSGPSSRRRRWRKVARIFVVFYFFLFLSLF